MPECIQIADPATGSTARVLAGFGFNCFEFRVNGPQGPLDVLWSVDDFASGQQRASSSGIPLLFPFPGRIGGEVFCWEGREYALQAGDGRGNAIHGFVLNRPWRVLERTPQFVVGQFHASRDAPELVGQWPADFCLTVSYELIGNALRSELKVENPDSRPLPCGLGTHPYFRLPLNGPMADNCLLTLPMTEQWELADMLPTGKRLPLKDAAAFAAGLRFGDVEFDNVFGGLRFVDGWCGTAISDPGSKLRLVQQFDTTFRECVVYTPPHREAVCIEPYTCVPGGQRLQAEQEIDAGFRILNPGESFVGCVEIRVEPVAGVEPRV